MTVQLDDDPVALFLAEAEAVELTLNYIDALNELADVVGIAVRDVFENMSRVDRADIARFITEAGPYAKAGAQEGADMAAAYLSQLTGSVIRPTDLTMPAVKYDDPFLRTWRQLTEGYDYEAARESGSSVAEMIGRDATRDGASERMGQPGTKVRGWRRVISAKACEWCRVVGTQIYTSQKTATFGHLGCKCEVVPVGDKLDPGKAINDARLRELKASGAVERVSAARERSRGRERDALLALLT